MPTETEPLAAQRTALDGLIADVVLRSTLDLTYRTELQFTTALYDGLVAIAKGLTARKNVLAGTWDSFYPPGGGTPMAKRTEAFYLSDIRATLQNFAGVLATPGSRTELQRVTDALATLGNIIATVATRLTEIKAAGYVGSIAHVATEVTHAPGTEPVAQVAPVQVAPAPKPKAWIQDSFGVFSPYEPYGKKVPAWEAAAGRVASWISDNPTEGDWNAAPGSDWGSTANYTGMIWNFQTLVWEMMAQPKHVVIGVPPFPKSLAKATGKLANGSPDPATTGLAKLARGDFDAKHTQQARMLVPLLNQRTAKGVTGTWKLRLRLWELNGNWMAGFGGADLALAKRAFERLIRTYKAVDPRFDFDWCPTLGTQNADAFAMMPDPSLLKGLAADVYDEAWDWAHRVPAGTPEDKANAIFKKRFDEAFLAGKFGLVAYAKKAAALGLEMNFTEWGCRNRASWDKPEANGGDNPVFVQGMHDHFRDIVNGVYGKLVLGHQCYFERADVHSSLMNAGTEFPKAAARYKALFCN